MTNKEQFLPTITTTGENPASSWQDKIKEIDILGLQKVAIFPTCLNKEQRQEMYNLLEKTKLKEIPLVHIRSDMSANELEYLQNKFKTRVFNAHTLRQYPFLHNLGKYYNCLFIENTWPWDEQEVKQFAGLCLDFSHLHDAKLLRPKDYENNIKIINKYPIGCNHISSMDKEVNFYDGPNGKQPYYSRHFFTELSQFDYLKNYPKEFFSNFCAIEVENSLADQLKAIDHIVKTLNS